MTSAHPTLGPSARLRPSPDVAAEPTLDELLVLDLASGRYFGLNRVGQLIWERLDGRTRLVDIADDLARRFSVDRERVLADVCTLATELVERGLAEVDAEP